MTDAADRRMLLVHAHPDDETIASGVTMAKYAAEDVQVTLVTCTLGEEGEILVPDLLHLGAQEQDMLGHHRITELTDAMKILGIDDFLMLGEPHKYRDSGMAGLPTNKRQNSFWQADLLEATADLVPVIRTQRPQVVITYDEFGAYGHPDHIQAHRVAMYGVMLAAAPSFRPELGRAWDVPKVYWTATPRSKLKEAIEALRASGDTSEMAQIDPDNNPFSVDDELVTTAIDGRKYISNKVAAMHAYPTQISAERGFFSFAALNDSAMGVEYFRLVKGQLGPVAADGDAAGYETDLFAGITPS